MTDDPPIAEAKETTRQSWVEAVRVALLGVNAWLVALVIPALHVGLASPSDLLSCALPLLALAPGVALLRSERLPFARFVLLACYPAALGGVIVALPRLLELEAYGTIGTSLAAASLLAFLAGAAHAVSRDRVWMSAEAQPLVGKEPVVEPMSRRWMRRALLLVAGAGAFLLTVVLPSLPNRRDRTLVWGDAAGDAAVLTSVVAATVAAVALGTLVGPGLRAARPARDEAAQRRRRLAVAMLLGTAAAVGWLLLQELEP